MTIKQKRFTLTRTKMIIHHWMRRGSQSDSYSHLTCMFLDCGRALDYLHNALEHVHTQTPQLHLNSGRFSL